MPPVFRGNISRVLKCVISKFLSDNNCANVLVRIKNCC